MLQHHDWDGLLLMAGGNIIFLIIQLLVISAWLSFRHQQWINITNGWLGLGDVLFLAALTCCFSISNYILFYVGSLITVLTIWTFGQQLRINKKRHIPLAGLQALLLIGVLIFCWFHEDIDLTSNNWLLKISR
ncbi:hypothetical protein [Mucilaginibacter boryungensis]|uniref:Prepilin peptidase CpaA n=1 Tax=Mucilaginibacter boryungensis TaxID=768480 RepID=A0ABR9XLH8_9SPHI|nr:hypothetical protein [Mucilaginibacter boryungensis]MBE9668243.1 hypothetical protein [Mucilaginibacter boryungensis]